VRDVVVGGGLLGLGRVREAIGDPAVGEVDGGQRGEQVGGEVGQRVLAALLQPALQVLARQSVVPGQPVAVAQALQRRHDPLGVVDLLGQAQRPPPPSSASSSRHCSIAIRARLVSMTPSR
jgi:hypothetical protein